LPVTGWSGAATKHAAGRASAGRAGFGVSAGSVGTVYTDDTYTWTLDPAGNPYIGSKLSVTDPGTGNAQSAKSTQVLDQYGNVTQSVIYPYNNTTTPLRTYTNTYVTSSGYLSNYVRNRLLTSTLTTLGVTKTLATNTYYTTISTDRRCRSTRWTKHRRFRRPTGGCCISR